MCSRGVFQLRKLSVFFCDFGGSSTGIRNTITSQQFKTFMRENPQVQFDFICKRNHHPYVRGVYINGYTKDVPLRSLEQDQAMKSFNLLRSQLGRKSFKASGKRVIGSTESIQGKWQPNIFNKYPIAELQKKYDIPEISDEKEQVATLKGPRGKRRDLVAQIVNVKSFRNIHQSA